MSKIDYSKFEDKTRGGYDWEVIVPEDGLIRVIDDEGYKRYLLVSENGEVTGAFVGDAVLLPDDYNIVLRKEEWRAGWRPPVVGDKYYTASESIGPHISSWYDDTVDKRRSSIGNCYPDTPRGKLLAEARTKYEPLIGEIAGMDEPEEVFRVLRVAIENTKDGDEDFDKEVIELAEALPDRPSIYVYMPAIRWLDSGYRLTIEEAEA